MNSNYNTYMGGNTGGTPITQLRNDIPEKKQYNDEESNYSIDSIKTSADLRQMIDNINNDIETSKKQTTDKNSSDNDTIENEQKEKKEKKKKDKKKK